MLRATCYSQLQGKFYFEMVGRKKASQLIYMRVRMDQKHTSTHTRMHAFVLH